MNALEFFINILAAKDKLRSQITAQIDQIEHEKQAIKEVLQLWLEDVRQGEADLAAGRWVTDEDLDTWMKAQDVKAVEP